MAAPDALGADLARARPPGDSPERSAIGGLIRRRRYYAKASFNLLIFTTLRLMIAGAAVKIPAVAAPDISGSRRHLMASDARADNTINEAFIAWSGSRRAVAWRSAFSARRLREGARPTRASPAFGALRMRSPAGIGAEWPIYSSSAVGRRVYRARDTTRRRPPIDDFRLLALLARRKYRA